MRAFFTVYITRRADRLIDSLATNLDLVYSLGKQITPKKQTSKKFKEKEKIYL
jgi:hypothetical protein